MLRGFHAGYEPPGAHIHGVRHPARGDQAAGELANWPQLQSELAALSSNSVHKLVAATSDASLLFTERDAAPSSVAIAEVLSSVRTGRPLYP